MKSEPHPPATQRAFQSPWIKLDYLCRKVRYWLYDRASPASARRYARRLALTLKTLPENDAAILRHEGQALLEELKGDVRCAVRHRRQEIRLMEKLLRDADTGGYTKETRTYMLKDRDEGALAERRAILERLQASLNSPSTTALT